MGKLAHLHEIKEEAHWYFDDTYYSNGRYVFVWPSSNYSYSAAIHADDLIGKNYILIAIRRWIEINLTETVITDIVNKSYTMYVDEQKSWDTSYEISNQWRVFYFEEEMTASAFRLRFSEYIKKMTNEHPKWLE